MRAKKENKIYQVTTEAEKQRYLKEGFDIYDDNGKIVEHSPQKKIAYGEYAKLQEENTSLKEENEILKTEVETLKSGVEGENDAEVIEILTAYAQEHEIDLGRSSSVSGIVKKIKEVKAGA